MNEDQCRRVYDRALKLFSKEKGLVLLPKFVEQAMAEEGVSPALAREGVRRMVRGDPGVLSGETVEALLCLERLMGPSEGLAVFLTGLLASDRHRRHEDVVSALQKLKDPCAVEALFKTALTQYPYLENDEFFGLARKCTWALADIGTPEARARLETLTEAENPAIAGFARKRLECWEKELGRKGPVGGERRA